MLQVNDGEENLGRNAHGWWLTHDRLNRHPARIGSTKLAAYEERIVETWPEKNYALQTILHVRCQIRITESLISHA